MINITMITHKHHIVPKHMGGSDDPDNLIELTIEEHAEAHRMLYEKYGKVQDKLAWQGLSGLLSNQELVETLLSETKKGPNNPMWGKPAPNRGIKRPGIGGRKKGTKWSKEERQAKEQMHISTEHREKMSKVWANPDRNKKIGLAHKGKVGAAAGKRWYNNSIQETYSATPIEGWQLGRKPKNKIN
jgi:hypothetical protein